MSRLWTGEMLAVGLALLAWTTALRVSAKALLASDVDLAVPAKAWAVASRPDGFLVFAAKWQPGPGAPQDYTRGRLDLVCGQVTPGALAAQEQRLTWRHLSYVPTLFPGYPPKIAALRSPSDAATLVTVETQGGVTVFEIGRVPDSALAVSDAKSGAAGIGGVAAQATVKWGTAASVSGSVGDHRLRLSALQFPALTALGRRVLLSGEGQYVSEGGWHLWAADITRLQGRDLTGVLLGEGWAPALMPAAGRLFCLAIQQVTPGYMSEDQLSGRIIGWVSEDGADWKPWEPGIPMQDVACVDACADGDRSFVACISGFPKPTIRLYEFDSASDKLREVYSFEVPEPEGVARRVVVRSLNGSPYIFWCRPQDDTTQVIMRRIVLPSEGGASQARAEEQATTAPAPPPLAAQPKQ